MANPALLKLAFEYASDHGIVIERALGYGTDGSVWASSRNTAVKVLERRRVYEVELECYQRLQQSNVTQIQGLAVPRLYGFDDDRQIVEIGLVTSPYILDFGKSSLDKPIDFSSEQLADWDEQGRELFEDRWPDVLTLLWALKQYGIYYYDAKPQNIMFGL